MKKHGKAYWGIILSFILALSVPFSAVTAAEEETELSIDEAEITETDGDENGAVQVLDDTPDGEEDETDGDQNGSDGDDDPDTVAVNGIKLNKSSVTLKVKGQTVVLKVTFDPENATYQDITWKSSNTSVATVTNGTVTAVDGGTATITATSTDNTKVSATCEVTVSLYSNGFHQDPDSSDWYYYTDGKVATGKTDVIKGTVNGTSGWWNVINGKVTKGETVAKNSNGWWYINSNGMVDFSYTGFAQNKNGWWYLEDGKVTFKKNSVIKDTRKKVDGTASWWYVVGSEVQTSFTGLADYKNSNGWWYISKGKVTFDVDTVAKNKNGWWYVKDSKVDFNYTGFAKNSNGWWYLENGKVTFKKNSVIKDTRKEIDGTVSWWYVVGSKVQTSFTGLADYKNSNGWWYINDGKVTFNVNTVAKNKNGWWYVKDSKVDFSYTGAAENKNGWWYISKGKVDFSTGTVAKVDSDWLYFYNGKHDSSYTGVAPNENGTWYVKNGKVDFSYSGTVTVSGQKYNVKDGRATKAGVTVSSTMNKKAQSQSSSTKWLIVVDTSACKLGVFSGSKGNWVAQKYWACSPGKPSTPTKKGKFKVQSKGKSFSGKTYTCWYYTQFYGNYLIHSVLYQKGSITKIRTGTLGKQLSHGCVRLAIENAKWVYDNIPRGTTVYIY